MSKKNKRKPKFADADSEESRQAMIQLTFIMIQFVDTIAVPLGMSKREFMDHAEAAWDMCPYMDNSPDEEKECGNAQNAKN